MAQNPIALYWGTDRFVLAELKKQNVKRDVTISFDTPLDTDDSPGDIPENIKLAALLKKAFDEGQFSSRRVAVSLPMRDLIFRSFLIPEIPLEEVAQVVEFEIAKYIPLPIEQLVHTHQTRKGEGAEKGSLRVTFFGIRKDILKRHLNILDAAGCELHLAEPSPVSLARLFNQTDILPKNKIAAVICLFAQTGLLMITKQDRLEFVREFPLPSAETMSLEGLKNTLDNNIRISLSFYTRQLASGHVQECVLIGKDLIEPLASSLSRDQGIPVRCVSPDKIQPSLTSPDPEKLVAVGMGIRFKKKNDFDLMFTDPDLFPAPARETSPDLSIKSALTSRGVICAAVIGLWGLHTYVSRRPQSLLAEKKKLSQDLGIYASSSVANIQELTETKTTLLKKFQAIPTQSRMHEILHRLGLTLPQGVWLTKISIQKQTSPSGKKDKPMALTLTMDGQAYATQEALAFSQIHNFIAQLKADSLFKEMFDKIDLINIRSGHWDNYDTKMFTILCE